MSDAASNGKEAWLLAFLAVTALIAPTAGGAVFGAGSSAFRGLHAFSSAPRHTSVVPAPTERILAPAPAVTDLGLNWSPWSARGSPEARYAAAMTYDPADHYLVMFSGVPASGPYAADTWAYSNDTWTEICTGTTAPPSCPTEPSADRAIPMTYDAADHYVLMVNSSGKTWSYVNGTWTQRATNQTLGSGQGAALAYDPAIGKALLVEPSGGMNCLTYAYSNGTWTQLSTVLSVPNRVSEVFFYDPNESRMVLFGGVSPSGSQTFGDMWIFSQDQWSRQSPSTLPPSGVPTGFSFDPAFGLGILFTGGIGGNFTWVYSKGNWTNQSGFLPTSPSPRDEAQMGYDGEQGYTLLFDGVTLSGTLNDSWVLYAPLSLSFNLSSAVLDVGQAVQVNTTVRGGIGPYNVTFPSLPPGCTQPPATWNFSCNPSQAGSFTITVSAQARLGANVSISEVLDVNPDPNATVEVTPNPTTVGFPAAFAAVVTGGTSPVLGNWTFGDGAYSIDDATAHSYATAGRFPVRFTAVDARGVSAQANLSLLVNPLPLVNASVDRAGTDVGLSLIFNSTGTGGTLPVFFEWQFGDGNVSLLENASHTYARPGVYDVSVTMRDSLNVNTSAFLTVRVNPDPLLVAGANVTTAAVNESVRFTSLASGGTEPYAYNWLFGDGSAATSQNATHAYNETGNFSVSLTITDSAGYERTIRFIVTVEPPPSTTPPNEPSGSGLLLTWLEVSGVFAGGVGFGGLVSWGALRRRQLQTRVRQERPDVPGAEDAPDSSEQAGPN